MDTRQGLRTPWTPHPQRTAAAGSRPADRVRRARDPTDGLPQDTFENRQLLGCRLDFVFRLAGDTPGEGLQLVVESRLQPRKRVDAQPANRDQSDAEAQKADQHDVASSHVLDFADQSQLDERPAQERQQKGDGEEVIIGNDTAALSADKVCRAIRPDRIQPLPPVLGSGSRNMRPQHGCTISWCGRPESWTSTAPDARANCSNFTVLDVFESANWSWSRRVIRSSGSPV